MISSSKTPSSEDEVVFESAVQKSLTVSKVRENPPNQIIWGEQSTVTEQQKPDNLDGCIQEVKDLSLTPETNPPIVVFPLHDLPPIEAAFSIEKIRNSIFSLLEPHELLLCRLVSTSWLRMATNDKLQQWKDIFLTEDYKEFKGPVAIVQGNARHFKDLIDLLDGMGSHPFPFSSLTIWGLSHPQNVFVTMLDSYGFLFKTLRLVFQAKDLESEQFIVYPLNSLLEFVTKLLTEQMPSLETLKLEFEKCGKFAGEIEPQLILSIKNSLYFAGKQNQSLRTIEIGGHVPFEIIDALCCLAPKATELWIKNKRSLEFWVKNKHRVHLIPGLMFSPSLQDWDKVEALQEIFGHEVQRGNLKGLATNFYRVRDYPDVWPRIATLLIKMFEKNCHSLENLHLTPFYFLPGTVLPPMPKVKRLSLNSYHDLNSDWSHLPQGTSLATTFPNLHTIDIPDDAFHRLTSVFEHFLFLVKNEQVTSVRRFTAFSLDCDEELFKRRFPNAVVTKG